MIGDIWNGIKANAWREALVGSTVPEEEESVDMTKEQFLSTEVKNCPECGNKIRPRVNRVQDMNATMECPSIGCGYCKTSAGLFWPGQFEDCLEAWEKK